MFFGSFFQTLGTVLKWKIPASYGEVAAAVCGENLYFLALVLEGLLRCLFIGQTVLWALLAPVVLAHLPGCFCLSFLEFRNLSFVSYVVLSQEGKHFSPVPYPFFMFIWLTVHLSFLFCFALLLWTHSFNCYNFVLPFTVWKYKDTYLLCFQIFLGAFLVHLATPCHSPIS